MYVDVLLECLKINSPATTDTDRATSAITARREQVILISMLRPETGIEGLRFEPCIQWSEAGGKLPHHTHAK